MSTELRPTRENPFTDEHELQDLGDPQRSPQAQRDESGPQGEERTAAMPEANTIPTTTPYDMIIGRGEDDPRRTGAVRLSFLRSWLSQWPDKCFFNGATDGNTRQKLKTNDLSYLTGLGSADIPAPKKIEILSEVVKEQMLRDESRKYTDYWRTMLGLNKLQGDNDSLFDQLSECLQKSAQESGDAPSTVALPEGNAARWELSGTDTTNAFSASSATPKVSRGGLELALTVDQTRGEPAGWEQAIESTERDFRNAIRRCMELGFEYFSSFDDPGKEIEGVLDSPEMSELLDRLGMSSKQYSHLCSALLKESTKQNEVDGADSNDLSSEGKA